MDIISTFLHWRSLTLAITRRWQSFLYFSFVLGWSWLVRVRAELVWSALEPSVLLPSLLCLGNLKTKHFQHFINFELGQSSLRPPYSLPSSMKSEINFSLEKSSICFLLKAPLYLAGGKEEVGKGGNEKETGKNKLLLNPKFLHSGGIILHYIHY